MHASRDPCDKHMSTNFGWLQRYLKVGFFTDYLDQGWHYFQQNRTSYSFLWLNSIAYANLDFVREVCPEAAQLALLIRAEERLPMREAELPLLQHAALAELPGADDGRRRPWPTSLGIARLLDLAAKLTPPEEYLVDMVMPYCDEPLDGLLSRSTGYEEEWLSTRAPLRHVNLVLYRLLGCAPDGSPLATQGATAIDTLPPRAKLAALQFRSVEVVLVDASPAAWEAARYMMHLARRYSSLADFTLFLHPDVFEHVNPRTLRNVLESLRVGSFTRSGLGWGQGGRKWYEYLSLSHHYITSPSRARTPSGNCTSVELGFADLRRQLLGAQGGDTAGFANDFGFYCCSQFMVHRDRVLQRSREWYERVAQSVAWEHCATSYMEILWHGIFNGGVLHEQKRQERTDLPLFLRVDNFNEDTGSGLI